MGVRQYIDLLVSNSLFSPTALRLAAIFGYILPFSRSEETKHCAITYLSLHETSFLDEKDRNTM